MVPLGVLFWCPSDLRGTVLENSTHFGTLFRIRLRQLEFPSQPKHDYQGKKRVPLQKKGTICSNNTPGVLFRYPFFLSEVYL